MCEPTWSPRSSRSYKSQGVDINDKHVEVIVRQMLKKRKVLDRAIRICLGQGEDQFELQAENQRVERLGGRAGRAEYLLLGITETSLATGVVPLGCVVPRRPPRCLRTPPSRARKTIWLA